MTAPVLQRLSDNKFNDSNNGTAGLVEAGNFFADLYIPYGSNSSLYLRVYGINEDNEIEIISSTLVNENGGLGSYDDYTLTYDPNLDVLVAIYSWFNGPSHYVQGNVCVVDGDGDATIKADQVDTVSASHNSMGMVYNPVRSEFVEVFTTTLGGYIRGVEVTDVPAGTISFKSVNKINSSSTTTFVSVAYSEGDDVPILSFSDSAHTDDLEFATLYHDTVRYQLNSVSAISDVNVTSGDNLTQHSITYDEITNSTMVILSNVTTAVSGLVVILTVSGSSVVIGLSAELSLTNITTYSYMQKQLCVIPDAGVLFLSYISSLGIFYDTFLTIDGDSVTASYVENVGDAGLYISAWSKVLDLLMVFNSTSISNNSHILSKIYPDPFWRDNQGQSEKVAGSPIEV